MALTFRKIVIRILLLALLLAGMNEVYKLFFYEHDLQEHSPVINKVREVPLDADIIYIGESSNITYRSDDADKRPISAFIGDHFPQLKVYDITKPASHAGIYKVLLENIPEKSQVQTIVVTLNLRSFNAQWIYSDLETALQKSMVLLQPYPPLLNRFLLSFKAYDIKTNEERQQQFINKWERDTFHVPFEFPYKNVREWDYAMATNGVKDENGNIDYPKTELACHFIKAYGFQIDTLHNARIKDFDGIIRLAQKRNWNLVFNLLAENTEKARQLVGDELIYFMETNSRILKDYYERRGVPVVDNLDDVPDEQFVDQNWTTEHYAEQGRKIVAKNVARALSAYYPDEYTDIDYQTHIQTHFFNNCENNAIWGQMQTITTEQAFSGNKSSKTGDGSEFSITFEYPFNKIPDSLKHQVRIRFRIYQESTNNDARLVIQANGENIEAFWEGYSLDLANNQPDVWLEFDKTFTIPERLYDADLIKIYLYNPAGPVIYVDDFDVEFLP